MLIHILQNHVPQEELMKGKKEYPRSHVTAGPDSHT